MEPISSRNNPIIKEVRALLQEKGRQRHRGDRAGSSGLFVAEGIRQVGEAVEADQAGAEVALKAIYYAPDYLTSSFARNLIDAAQARGKPCYPTSAEVFDSIASRENPQGILAILRAINRTLANLTPEIFVWGVALVSPQDPGNIGAILRTVDAVGANGMLLLDGGANPYHPQAVRASMGAMFWYPMVSTTFSEFAHWVSVHGYHVYGTSAHAERQFDEGVHYQRPMILLLGSEREGLSSEQTSICEAVLRLPMKGRATSLNLAVAAGVMLYAMLSIG